MNKIPSPVLSFILTISGPFPEVLRLSIVCKRGLKLLKNAHHYVSFEGSNNPSLIPGSIEIGNSLAKFMSGGKLTYLNLKNVFITDYEFLANILISQRNLLSLDLSNNHASLESLGITIDELKGQIENPDANFDCPLEVLRITNNKSSVMGYNLLVKHFQNLKKLYAGNTDTGIYDFKIIIQNLPKLELLDLSNCHKLYDVELISTEICPLVKISNLKKFFITCYETCLELGSLNDQGIQTITNSISDILSSIKRKKDFKLLENWISLGGDINLRCDKPQILQNGKYPQSDIICQKLDENLLIELFIILIRAGLDLSYHSSIKNRQTLLNSAISYGYKRLVKLLIDLKSDMCPIPFTNLNEPVRDKSYSYSLQQRIRSSNRGELPAMTQASASTNISIVKQFFNANLHKINCYTSTTCNPVCIAAKKKRYKMFNYLVREKFPYYKCHNHGNYLLINPKILETVLDENYIQIVGIPLEMAYEAARFYISNGNDVLVIRLLEIMIQFGIKEKELEFLPKNDRENPYFYKPLLILSVIYKSSAVLSWLLEHGFDINIEDTFGWTGFIFAADSGQSDMIEYLHRHGADINKQIKRGQTALHQAAESGHIDVVEKLINIGASLSPETNEGSTPLDYAKASGRTEIYELLLNHGAVPGSRCKTKETKETKETKKCILF